VQVEVVDPRGTLGWAGVRRGDVLEGLGGERLGGSLDEWRSAFDRMGVGAKVTVDVSREGQRSRIETEVLPRRALSPRGEDIADSSVSPRQVVFEKLMEV
jgi:predicted metalloprotease with PDZ domain